MSSSRRRALVGTLVSVLFPMGGCLRTPSQPDSDNSRIIRVADPVQTTGDPIRIIRSVDPANSLTAAIANRLDCSVDELPVDDYEDDFLLTTTTITSTSATDVAFPSPSYHRIKRVAPKSVTVASNKSVSSSDTKQVYIRAILRRGDREEVSPDLARNC